ncbi:MAG: glucokinase [Bacteroidota bacterium]
MRKSLIPIAFPKLNSLKDGATVIAADVGGTKSDLAFFCLENGVPVLKKQHRYASANWTSFADMVVHFYGSYSKPDRLAISFAGPIKDGKATGTNLHFGIDAEAISKALGIDKVLLINDLEANCYGLAALEESDFKIIYNVENREPGNAAVISPGTGLGEGGLYWDGTAFRPFATEGGHSHFAPRYELDWELFKYLSERYGHVSWERVVSGMGICNIFEFLRDTGRGEIPESLKHHVSAPEISAAAEKGSKICQETLKLFSRYLAQEAANLALKFKSTGGLFIGGGIMPKIWGDEYHNIFHEYFFAVGRLYPLVATVPVTLILNQKAALLGAGYYGAYS